jgi:hypothetical protein
MLLILIPKAVSLNKVAFEYHVTIINIGSLVLLNRWLLVNPLDVKI